MNKYTVEEDFIKICEDILKQDKSIEEWREIESDDMYQKGNYTGGFDATEDEFTFSVYVDKKEYWFQVSLEKVAKIVNKEINEVDIAPAS